MKKFNFIALLLLMMLSCMTSYDSQMTVDHLTVSNKENLPADDISYKSAKIVSLETNDECLMEDVREVCQYQSYIYVLDTRGDLFVFDLWYSLQIFALNERDNLQISNVMLSTMKYFLSRIVSLTMPWPCRFAL